MALPRFAAGLVVAWAALWLVVPGAVDAVHPQPMPDLIGEEAREQRRLDARAQWNDGTRARRIEFEQRIRSRTREWLGPWWGAVLLRFGNSVRPDVIAAADGSLLGRGRVDIAGPDAHEHMGNAACVVAATSRRIAALGVETYVLPIPRKAALSTDVLPRGVDGRKGADRAAIDALIERGVRTVDLLSVLEVLAPQRAYMKYDSHWSVPAQVATARAAVEAVLGRAPSPVRSTLRTNGTRPERRSNLDLTGIDRDSPAVALLDVPDEPVTELASTGSGSIPAVDLDTMHRHAITGTSFTRTYDLPALLAHFVDDDVTNVSVPGSQLVGSFLRTTEVALRNPGGPRWPDVLWYEVPLHQFAQVAAPPPFDLHYESARTFTFLPTGPLHALTELALPPSDPGPGTLLESGRLLASGTGIAMLRLRAGSQAYAKLEADAFQCEHLVVLPRPEGLVFPLLASGPMDGAVRLRPGQPEGRPSKWPADLRTELVTDLDLSQGRLGTVQRTGSGSRWQRTVAFEGATVERHDGLALRLESVGRSQTVRVAVRWHGKVLELAGRSGPDGWILIDATPLAFAGAAPAPLAVDLSGAGQPLEVRSARLAPLARRD